MPNNSKLGKDILKVDVAPEMLLYRILQSQSYDEEAAISEFVDNSIQSFLDSKDAIVQNENTINIEVDSKNKNIVIEDNAGGIHRDDLQQAITMGRDPNKPHLGNSLSVYGMGLKSSAIWFSSQWKLETSCIDSSEKLSFVFDLDNLLASNSSEIIVNIEEEEVSNHYTKITLLNHSRRDSFEFYKDTVLPFLLETFFKFEDIKININYDNIAVLADEKKMFIRAYPPLNAQKFNRPGKIESANSISILWEKNIDFTIGDRSVYGFVRIMNHGKYKQPGIRLLRNKRVIQGTSLKSNLPEGITGTKNKYGAQRFYGEIHLDKFLVNYQKTGFNEDLSGVYSKIKEILVDGDNFISQANNYRSKAINPKEENEKQTKDDKENNGDNAYQKSENDRPSTDKTYQSPTKITKSEKLYKALERTDNTKLPKLYGSLCKVSLKEHPILMYVGVWSFLEALSTLMGKDDRTAFNSYLGSKVNLLYKKDKSKKNDVKGSIDEIHKKGNSSKHSDKKHIINGAQLHNDFEVMEEFLIHCLNEL